jgi:hypothetical protein
MMTEIPFKHLRITLKATQLLCANLLGMEELTFTTEQYGMFIGMNKVTEKMQNPSRRRYIAMIITWLKYYWSLVQTLPVDNEIRKKSEAELMKVSAPFKQVLGNDWMITK